MICVNGRFLTRHITGAQRYAAEVTREMVRQDASVAVLGPHDMGHPDLRAELGAEVVGRRTGIPWEQWDLPRALAERGKPALIGMTFTAPLRYRPSIITVHDVCFTVRDWVSRGFYHYYGWIVPRLCRSAARVVTVSEFSKGEIVAKLGVPAEKVEVVYNAVAPSLAAVDVQAAPNPHGDYVLGVATLQKRKNFAGLVRAFRALDRPGLQLIIVGSADKKVYGHQPELQRMLADPRVHLTGYVDDEALAVLYHHARLFCYPSLYEGFGIPPIEAMSFGCPVVTSNVTSLPEVCGDAAAYVDPTDDASITAAMARLLDDRAERQDLAERGRRRAAAFSWVESGRRFLEIARACG